LKVKVGCEAACDLRGKVIKLILPEDAAREVPLTSFDNRTNETSEFILPVPRTVGVHNCRVIFPKQGEGRASHTENETSLVLKVEPHKTSLAVWDVNSPVVVRSTTRIKVGAKCSAGCVMHDCEIEIRDDAGVRISTAKLGSVPWPETTALHWTEVDLPTPENEGTYSWSANLKPQNLNVPHESASFPFGLIAVRAPDHTVTLSILEKDTKIAIPDVQVRLGPHKGETAESGSAILKVPKGAYELNVWKAGYEAQSANVDVFADTRIQVEMVPAPEPETPYWMQV
jgi:hypothetical protein